MSRLRALIDQLRATHQGRHTRAALRRPRPPAGPFGPALRIDAAPVADPGLTMPFPMLGVHAEET